MNIRTSRVISRIRQGQVVSCTKLNTADPIAAEIAAICGLDCVWTDMEHVANDFSTIARQIMAAKSRDCDTLVRVARGGYSDYIRPLELDAAGIMVPHVMSLEDARRVVRMTKFQPIGMRPADGGNADGVYCLVDFREYLEQANRERFVMIQIEDPEPLAELDAIAALDGIDALFFGPGDFSHALGEPGNFNHPELLRARAAVAEAARRHGKWAGTVASLASRQAMIDLGYQFLSIGADVVALSQYYSEIAAAFAADRTDPGETERSGRIYDTAPAAGK